jgi:hypothetical protein
VRGEEIAYFKENSVKSVHFLQEQERRKKGRSQFLEEIDLLKKLLEET